jgi:hypothetical protein
MATTSVLGIARARLVEACGTGELEGKFHYAWPGAEISKGRHEVFWIDDIPKWNQSIPNLKAGRKQRQEEFSIEIVGWVSRPGEPGDVGARATFERMLELLAVLENNMADDVQLENSAFQWLQLTERVPDLVPHERGWACMVVSTVEGQARLT